MLTLIHKFFFPTMPASRRVNATLLLLRLVAGVAFMMHGWGKIQMPVSWMGPQATTPGWLQFLAALSEFGGGLAWVIGLLVPLASFGIACTMAVAVYLHMIVLKDPFVNLTGGNSYELGLIFFSIALFLMVQGPGRYSLDMIFSRRR
jgi:putative oxidoreductase